MFSKQIKGFQSEKQPNTKSEGVRPNQGLINIPVQYPSYVNKLNQYSQHINERMPPVLNYSHKLIQNHLYDQSAHNNNIQNNRSLPAGIINGSYQRVNSIPSQNNMSNFNSYLNSQQLQENIHNQMSQNRFNKNNIINESFPNMNDISMLENSFYNKNSFSYQENNQGNIIE